jgi:hypothetical protein
VPPFSEFKFERRTLPLDLAAIIFTSMPSLPGNYCHRSLSGRNGAVNRNTLLTLRGELLDLDQKSDADPA